MTYPAGTPSMCTTRPHEPHSRSTSETQASFSSSVEPKSPACLPRLSDSSQKTQRRQRLGRSSKLSSVSGAMCQDTCGTSGDRSRWDCGWPPPCASTNPTIDRSSLVSPPETCDRHLCHDEGQDVPPSRLHSIGSSLLK